MKRLIYLLIPAMIFASCGGKQDKATELAKLKKERGEIDLKIKALEAGSTDSAKVIPVSVITLATGNFNAYVEVQSQISGDENILVVPQAQGSVKSIMVQAGQKVHKGQVLATLDASPVDMQIETLGPQLTLTKALYEKQQALWKQNIGTEVQLMSSKAQYEGVQKQIEALKAQRDLYRIVSPISGVVDALNLKVGDYASPAAAAMGSGIKVVSYDKLKAEANLGENYLGSVKQGNAVTLIMPDVHDTIKTKLSYVSQAIDPVSRAFMVQVHLPDNNKLHPNMSCIMKIANYNNPNALVVPVSVIQKTSQGSMIYITDGKTAKPVLVTTGRNSNGMVEILSGLKAGDQVITAGYESMEDVQQITIQ